MVKRIRVVRVVLDTNIFLRSLIRKGNTCFKIIELWKEEQFILITSRQIINEIADVLKRSFLVKKYGYDLDEVESMINLITQKAIFVEPAFSLKLCRDKDDDKFIDCSVLGRVNVLVSEDKDIIADQKLKKQLFEYGIDVKNALEFFHLIKNEFKAK